MPDFNAWFYCGPISCLSEKTNLLRYENFMLDRSIIPQARSFRSPLTSVWFYCAWRVVLLWSVFTFRSLNKSFSSTCWSLQVPLACVWFYCGPFYKTCGFTVESVWFYCAFCVVLLCLTARYALPCLGFQRP